jgi:hypothetical protein
MKFFKEICLIVLFGNGRFFCRDSFEIWVLFSKILIEKRSILCEFVHVFHANAFIKCRIPAQLYGIEKRIWKEYGYHTHTKQDKNGNMVNQRIAKYCYGH